MSSEVGVVTTGCAAGVGRAGAAAGCAAGGGAGRAARAAARIAEAGTNTRPDWGVWLCSTSRSNAVEGGSDCDSHRTAVTAAAEVAAGGAGAG